MFRAMLGRRRFTVRRAGRFRGPRETIVHHKIPKG